MGEATLIRPLPFAVGGLSNSDNAGRLVRGCLTFERRAPVAGGEEDFTEQKERDLLIARHGLVICLALAAVLIVPAMSVPAKHSPTAPVATAPTAAAPSPYRAESSRN